MPLMPTVHNVQIDTTFTFISTYIRYVGIGANIYNDVLLLFPCLIFVPMTFGLHVCSCNTIFGEVHITVTCLPLWDPLLLPDLSGLPLPGAVSCSMSTSRLSCLAPWAEYSSSLTPRKRPSHSLPCISCINQSWTCFDCLENAMQIWIQWQNCCDTLETASLTSVPAQISAPLLSMVCIWPTLWKVPCRTYHNLEHASLASVTAPWVRW